MFIKECKSVLLVAFCDVSDMWGFTSHSRIFHSYGESAALYDLFYSDLNVTIVCCCSVRCDNCALLLSYDLMQLFVVVVVVL